MSDRKLQPRTYIGLDGLSRTRQVLHFKAGGQDWSVYEEKGAEPTLIFETDCVARRVRSYPAAWAELADDELYALSWGR